MWGRNRKPAEADKTSAADQLRLKDAVRDARIEAAERTGVVVDLRDAELARLELLDEALQPLFRDIPENADLFDHGISRGDTPRLWIDVVAHVEMGRDKRQYRFVQDTRYGRKVLAESHELRDTVVAVTRYVARRLVERERALADDSSALIADAEREARVERRRRRWRTIGTFLLGLILGAAALVAAVLVSVR